MSEKLAKAVFGELTLGEVWESVMERVDEVRVEDPAGDTLFTTFHTTPGVSLGFSNHSAEDEDLKPEYSFDFNAKVKVRENHIELLHEDWFGEETKIQIYFLFRPETQVIGLDFLIKG